MTRSAAGIREVICSACRRPMRPAPSRPIFNEFAGMGISFLCALQRESAKKRPVTLSTRFGTPHAREDILFHDNPSVIIVYAQPLSDYAKGHITTTQFTKDPVLYCFEIIPAFCASLLSNLRLAIFEVHMHNT